MEENKPKFEVDQIVKIIRDEYTSNISNRPIEGVNNTSNRKVSPKGGIIRRIDKGYKLQEEFRLQNTHSSFHTTSCRTLTTLKELSEGEFVSYVYRIESIQPTVKHNRNTFVPTSEFILCKEDQLELSEAEIIFNLYE
jgi:hypothetical protein